MEFDTLLEAVRAETSGERALATVRALAGFHRVQASPGYDEAADWLAGELAGLGLTPAIERAAGDGRTRHLGHLMPEGWECRRAEAWLVDGATRERLCGYPEAPLSLVLRSGPAAGRHPLVLEEAAAVRDAVVLTDAPVQRVHERAVVGRGAAGLLSFGRRLLPPVRERDTDPDSLAYTSFWWAGDEPRGFGFVVAPRTGERLRDRLRAGAALALEVTVEARAFPTTIPLLSASLPGPRPGEVLVLAHLCHPRPSANDNASGAAAVLECARVLAALRARGAWAGGRTVRFLWVPEFTGTYAWLAGDPGRARATVAALNLDMVGQDQAQCGSTLLLEHPPCFAASFAEELLAAIRARALDWVPTYSGPGHHSLTRTAEVPFGGGSDHAVLLDPATGVPCPLLIQWPDRYYHSSLDTPERTSPDSLALAVRCAATYAGALAAAGDDEARALLARVARGARRRLLAALDAPDPARAAARAAEAGRSALASLDRLGVAPAEVAAARDAFADFARREAGIAGGGGAGGAGAAGGAWRPRRSLPVPLHGQRHLLPGWRALDPALRETWRAREEAEPDGALLTELAWYACDGRRSLAAIADLVWLESGRAAAGFLEEFFTLTERLGLSGRDAPAEAPCRSVAPDTASS